MKKFWLIVPVLATLGLLGLYHFATPPQASSTGVTTTWQLKDLTGQSRQLSDYQGQVKLINFWASWCGTCRDEMPDIVKTYHKFRDRGFTVLAIDYGEEEAPVRDFVRAYGMEFPVLMDPGKVVAGQYQVLTMPTSLLLDRHGVIRNVGPGHIDTPKLEAAIEALLSEKSQ